MKHIGNLTPAEGARKKRKRIGRGQGSGHGGTSTKGHKGHQSRSGFKQLRGFEGGQMPLHRRIPKFGFKNRDRVEYQVVNLATLQRLADEGKFEGGTVDFDALLELGVIRKSSMPLKVLGNGDISSRLHITAHKFSETAKEKIESAGGTVTIHG
jgi:large subunit ribosomal protein L15